MKWIGWWLIGMTLAFMAGMGRVNKVEREHHGIDRGATIKQGADVICGWMFIWTLAELGMWMICQ